MNESEQFRKLFADAARETLVEGLRKVKHCLDQLTDEQVWWRPREEMNSIANLLLHLSGNLRQWILSGVGGEKDVRNRPAEFSDRSNDSKGELLAKLQATVEAVDRLIDRLSISNLAATRRIQGFDTSVTGAIWRVIPHFRGHVQEIIHITREQLGEKYRFDFVPKGKEQVSAHDTTA